MGLSQVISIRIRPLPPQSTGTTSTERPPAPESHSSSPARLPGSALVSLQAFSESLSATLPHPAFCLPPKATLPSLMSPMMSAKSFSTCSGPGRATSP